MVRDNLKLMKLFLNYKRKKKLIITLFVLGCFLGVFGVICNHVYGGNGYTLGSAGSAIVAGTTPGNAEIWPVTHPVFIVQLTPTEKGMGTEINSYDTMAQSILTVIPYASEDALWLCSNKASKYLINKGFNDEEQVYLARKTSLSSTGLNLIGGENNKAATGRVMYLSKNEYTTFGKDIDNGVFYNEILKLFVKNNRNMEALTKDSEFLKLIDGPDATQKNHSAELWSYITEVNASGSDSEGWEYHVNIKEKIDQFLHYNELNNDDKGLKINNWNDTSNIEYQTGGYTITVGEGMNLRYLDLLMTLNAISNNPAYWSKGIKSYMVDNNGGANISITQAIIARTDCLSTANGNVKPATVFVSCNDLTQDAYRIKSTYNLSDVKASKTVYDEANSVDYIKRLKAAVSLSKPNNFLSTSIYSSAIISRVISERVKSVSNNTLVWGSSNNLLNLIKLTRFKFKNDIWDGANWVLEPPISSLTVNYQAILKVDSKDLNQIKNVTGPVFKTEKRAVDLFSYYPTVKMRQQKTVITDDDVTLQLSLNALTSSDEWKTFIQKNNITEFKIQLNLNRNQQSNDFIDVPIGNRVFTQEYTPGETWCTSDKWVSYTKDEFLSLIEGKKPVGQWKDDTIARLQVSDGETKDVSYCARVYIIYKTANNKWYYTSGKPFETKKDNLIESSDDKVIVDIRRTNKAELSYLWHALPITLNYPTADWASEEPALVYAELKEGSIYNETFEAMAGVPTTRTLYFSSGGNEFMVDLQVAYEPDTIATREYISHYNGTECEYKTNDQLKGGTGTYTNTETFVGDATGKTISKSVISESSKITTPTGISSVNLTVNSHTSDTTLWAEWTGSIGNNTSEPSDIGKFDPGKPGTPCAGLGYNVGTQRSKAEPATNWDVNAYNTALNQAIAWAQSMEATNSIYTLQKIADSDGQIRQYQVGDAEITVTLTDGSNSYSHTTQRSYSGGTYTSSGASGATLTSSDKGKLGSGWGFSNGQLGSGGGYVAGNHGHGGVCPGNDKLISPAKYDSEGHKTADAVYGPCGSVHSCGYFTPGTDITQGASATTNYTIKVTFKNGTLKALNYDGNSSDVTITTKTGLTGIPAHALCGPCCSHDLPDIEDIWYQDSAYDTIQITKCNVYKIEKGYVTGMEEITYNSDENLIAGITQGDPNIFYNIAADNGPIYENTKLTNPSKIGRIRYSLQEAQGDKVYYEEMSKGADKRTNKCDGLSTVQCIQNPATLVKKGHDLGFASGILYSNGTTSGYGNAAGLVITKADFLSDNTATNSTLKTVYGNKLDSKDLLTDEWKRFFTRRTQEVTATVISDMLILQTSSGDQSPVYYEETTKAKAQEDFPTLQASGDVEKIATQDEIDAKWVKMWINNKTTFAKTRSTAINVGSYIGKYNLPSSKYQGTGMGEKITTRFDNDAEIFATPKDELGLAKVKSNQSFSKPANGTSNIASSGKANARMDRVSNLLIYIDKIKQKPTNENGEYETGDSFVFYKPILKYKVIDTSNNGNTGEKGSKDAFDEVNSQVLMDAGFNYGLGLLYNSKYSAYEDDVSYKVNNIVTLNAVSTQNAMMIKSEVEDQRTKEGIVKDAMKTLSALEKCPGTPELCEYRKLNCKYTLDTTSLSFAFEDEIVDSQSSAEANDIYSSYTGQIITNSIKNSDGALTSYEAPAELKVTAGDGTYAGFGTYQLLKVTGNGTRLKLPYSDCRIYRTSSARVKISADVYIPSQPKTNTMLFSIGSVGLYIPANSNSPVFISSTGQTRAATATDIVGKKVKILATFSLGSLYDCELSINGNTVVPQITSGLTDAQIAAAAIDDDMRGSGVNIGCWDFNTSYATDFYMDNLVITRCGGTLAHTASCYITYKKEKSYYQDIFNGLTTVNNTIDWTRVNDDGVSYGTITNYSKHVHDSTCLTQASKGYQIAVAEAKDGNWTDLKKELGTTLFNMAVAKFDIDTTSGASDTGNNNTNTGSEYEAGTVLSYSYTGATQPVTLPAGTYKLETWGAQGGGGCSNGTASAASGYGGYSAGTITLTDETTLYVNIGGKGNGPSNTSAMTGGWNGGGSTISDDSDHDDGGGSGGGATDISLKFDSEKGAQHLYSRVIVAGGGAGNGFNSYYSSRDTGDGGGLNATVTASNGYSTASQTYGYAFGYGGIGSIYSGGVSGGGGGGWYGGYAGNAGDSCGNGGDGGSGYVYTSSSAGSYPSGCLLNSSYYLPNAQTIAGNVSMPSTTGSTETGHTGNGYSKITVIESANSNPTGKVTAGQVYNYNYTGNVQAITLPKGTYKLETYGAQGGDGGEAGGKGGYSAGTVTLSQKTTLYLQVGGKGAGSVTGTGGGYNGGGNTGASGLSGGGGGASSIATVTGTLSSVLQNAATKNNVLLVAGGGGGAGNNQTAGGTTGTWYHTSGCSYEYETHTTTSSSYCTTCGHSCGYFVGWNSTTYYVGAGGTGGGISGGNGGTTYNTSYNGLGGTSGSYYTLGQGQALSGGGGGGGYYGGFAAPGIAGAGGGSGYAASQLASTSMSNGVRSGSGKITVTVIEAYNFPDDTELFNYIKSNMNLIPDTVTTDGKTIVNPIWNCKLINNTGKTYIEETMLTCTEPHHSGGHYDYSNDICWSACGNDENHKTTKPEVVDANGDKVEQAEYITLDNFFKVYFPNTGDFYGDGSYGIAEPSFNRGKGYTQSMDTTEWTREKYVKFDFDVLYERNGVWESHPAGSWIPLEIIDKSTTRTYTLSGGTTLTLKGNTYVFDKTCQLMKYNKGSTTLVEGGTMAIIDGTIFVLNEDGTVNVSEPCMEYNFYCLLSNNEFSCAEVQYAVEGINYDEQSKDETPYGGDGEYQDEYDIYRYGNTYNTNKQRFSDFTSNHTASKLSYIDVVGRIGNLIIEDTDDMRFSNFFKKPVAETDWFIDGIISKVDSSISENYLSWHRNSAGYPLAVDVRGEQVSEKTGYYNTWGTQEWTARANSESLGVSADKNSETILQGEQLKLGYNVLFDITTMGNYDQYLQAVPYFYALNTKTRVLVPVDVYINDDGTSKPINYFGLYSEYMDEDGNYKDGYEALSKNLYRYNMYLNWTNESARRNYTAGGLEAQVSDRVRDYFIEEIWNSDGEITGYKYLTVPYGNYYSLGTMQCLQPGRRARTFVGNSIVNAIEQQSERLGITANGINGGIETNLNGDYIPEMFYRQAQRWHLTMGLPSSATFTAYREKGVHVKPEDDWFVAAYEQDGVAKSKEFSKAYLVSNIGDKDYAIGSTFTISGVVYSITGKYNAGREFNNNDDYVILMTADIKVIGDVWNLKYKAGEDNGNITINGTTYQFGSSIPNFIGAYDTVSSLVDISTEKTH